VLDLVEQPDLAQTLVCTCAFMNRTFRFTGLQSLKIKETDRIYALRTELAKLGYDIEEENDSVLFWNGRRRSLPPSEQVSIDTYDDHRMAMAFACACLPFGVITVNAPEVVSKSYPNYWQEFPQSHD
jgi:3-phosphoshikimate 1-carboxyvinyltransferase